MVSGYFRTKNYVWKLCIIQKSFWILPVFDVWLLCSKMCWHRQIIAYFRSIVDQKIWSWKKIGDSYPRKAKQKVSPAMTECEEIRFPIFCHIFCWLHATCNDLWVQRKFCYEEKIKTVASNINVNKKNNCDNVYQHPSILSFRLFWSCKIIFILHLKKWISIRFFLWKLISLRKVKYGCYIFIESTRWEWLINTNFSWACEI